MNFMSVVFGLIFIVYVSEGLNLGDKGVCTGKQPKRNSIKKWYTSFKNPKCGRKCGIVKKSRIEYKTVYVNRSVCCAGWIYNAGEEVCDAVCSRGCDGGSCIAPETCAPNVCDPPCLNAICIQSVSGSSCQCNENFTRHNDTHCYSCDSGYGINDLFNCTPICNRECLNGVCSRPNHCTCNEGYRNSDNFTCEPVCDSCVNSKCTAPNECTCLESFVRINQTVCAPPSDCENGSYVDGKCICDIGYVQANGVCAPHCEGGCVNGYCSAFNTCSCFEGYERNDTTTNLCTKICDEECNGTCDDTGQCFESCQKPMKSVRGKGRRCRSGRCPVLSSPPQSVCCDGWEYDHLHDICKPLCEGGCLGGECIYPNKCRCLQGYQRTNSSQFQCTPECDPPCENSTCIAIGVCACLEGYEHLNSHQCNPVCTNCEHGECIGPGDCRCNEGFSKKDGICTPHCDHVCTNGYCSGLNICSCNSGYKQYENKTNCVPECEKECINASCVEPDTCSCLSGFETVDAWSCRPVCDNCQHGRCVEPYVCMCDDGYSMKMNDTHCTPDCREECVEGYCTAPDVCSCNPGYALNNASKFICEPTCTTQCVNATCAERDTCSCWEGYEVVSSSVCKPKCSSCEFGECVAPGNCSCLSGYELLQEVCAPVCSKQCVNGNCSSPNTCTCLEGYQKNASDWSICYRPCEGLCKYGYCNLNGECICDSGIDTNGTCKALDCNECTSKCADGVCLCKDGRQCEFSIEQPAEIASSRSLAGLELSWILGGAIGLLLIVLVMVVLQRIYHKRQEYDGKAARNGERLGSVVYTLPNTLVSNRPDDDPSDDEALTTRLDAEGTGHQLLGVYQETERI